MTFYDVKHRQYQDYMNDVEKVKPYRGKVAKAYPLGNRKYSARHFTVGEDGVVSVWNSSFTYIEDTREGETQPRRETAMPHAYVYPDNTVQILKAWDVAMLSKVVGQHVCHSKKYGGSIVRDNKGRLHPLFKDARISLADGKMVTPYEWYHPTVNRKRAKEHLKKYDDLKKLHPMFLNSMNSEGFKGMFEDFEKELGDKWQNSRYFIFDKFEEMVNAKRYADATVYIATHSRNWWWASYQIDTNDGRFTEHVQKFMATEFDNYIYKKAGAQVFDYTLISADENIKSSKWTPIVKSNGQAVERI
jgi:hypothetical protein